MTEVTLPPFSLDVGDDQDISLRIASLGPLVLEDLVHRSNFAEAGVSFVRPFNGNSLPVIAIASLLNDGALGADVNDTISKYYEENVLGPVLNTGKTLLSICSNVNCTSGSTVLFECVGCGSAAYCSPECQKSDWETFDHKTECGASRLTHDAREVFLSAAGVVRSLHLELSAFAGLSWLTSGPGVVSVSVPDWAAFLPPTHDMYQALQCAPPEDRLQRLAVSFSPLADLLPSRTRFSPWMKFVTSSLIDDATEATLDERGARQFFLVLHDAKDRFFTLRLPLLPNAGLLREALGMETSILSSAAQAHLSTAAMSPKSASAARFAAEVRPESDGLGARLFAGAQLPSPSDRIQFRIHPEDRFSLLHTDVFIVDLATPAAIDFGALLDGAYAVDETGEEVEVRRVHPFTPIMATRTAIDGHSYLIASAAAPSSTDSGSSSQKKGRRDHRSAAAKRDDRRAKEEEEKAIQEALDSRSKLIFQKDKKDTDEEGLRVTMLSFLPPSQLITLAEQAMVLAEDGSDEAIAELFGVPVFEDPQAKNDNPKPKTPIPGLFVVSSRPCTMDFKSGKLRTSEEASKALTERRKTMFATFQAYLGEKAAKKQKFQDDGMYKILVCPGFAQVARARMKLYDVERLQRQAVALGNTDEVMEEDLLMWDDVPATFETFGTVLYQKEDVIELLSIDNLS